MEYKNEPIGQHTVPRCYLKNFNNMVIHKKKRKKYFVDVFDKLNGNKECYTVNINNICKVNDFYTFSNLLEKDQRILEKLFSETTERDYGLIYPLLMNKNGIKLSNSQRVKLIYFVISLFFRTSASTKQIISMSEKVLKNGLNLVQLGKTTTKINTITGNIYDLSTQDSNEILSQERNSAKEAANLVKFELAFELSAKRRNDIVTITRIHPSHFLVASDNPVYFIGDFRNAETLIKIPLNHEYLLTIYPRSTFNFMNHKEVLIDILDEEFSYLETTCNNNLQIERAERFIIGKAENIMHALKAKSAFDENDYAERTKKCLNRVQEQFFP